MKFQVLGQGPRLHPAPGRDRVQVGLLVRGDRDPSAAAPGPGGPEQLEVARDLGPARLAQSAEVRSRWPVLVHCAARAPSPNSSRLVRVRVRPAHQVRMLILRLIIFHAPRVPGDTNRPSRRGGSWWSARLRGSAPVRRWCIREARAPDAAGCGSFRPASSSPVPSLRS